MLHLTKQKARHALNQLKEKLLARFADKVRLYVYGSVARGDFGPESDIDVLVLLEQKGEAEFERNINKDCQRTKK